MDIAELLGRVMKYFDYLNSEKEIRQSNNTSVLNDLLDNYADYLCTVFNNSSIEITYTIIDYLKQHNYEIFYKLLEKNNDKVMQSFIMMKKFDDINPVDIKKNLNKIISELKDDIYLRGLDERRKEKTFNRESKEYELLNKYLKTIDDEKIDKIIQKDIESFYFGLHNIDKALFYYSDTHNNKGKIIKYLFNYSGMDMDIINKIYQEVLLQNETLLSYDYTPIILFNNKYIRNIKGLFKKCHEDFFKEFSKYHLSRQKCETINQILADVVRINSDDEIGLAWFFSQMNMHIPNNLKKYLEKFDYYNKYSNIDIKKMYDAAINKLLNGDTKGIDFSIITSIGLYNGFLDKYDEFLDKFCNSENREYQDLLLIPLTTGLAEIQRRKNNLDFRILLTNHNLENNTVGLYNYEFNFLYINPAFIKLFYNKKEALAYACKTVFHEVRHAKQELEIKRNNSLNFDTLLLSMDKVLSIIVPKYYDYNYSNISFEKDARRAGYIESVNLFKDREDIGQYLEEEKEDGLFTLLTREDPSKADKSSNECSIIQLFTSKCNEFIKAKGLHNLISIIKGYPILNRYFDIDLLKRKIQPRDNKYFDKTLDRVDQITDASKKKDALYAIKMFNYALKVQKYIDEKNLNYSELKYQSNTDMEESIGSIPHK